MRALIAAARRQKRAAPHPKRNEEQKLGTRQTLTSRRAHAKRESIKFLKLPLSRLGSRLRRRSLLPRLATFGDQQAFDRPAGRARPTIFINPARDDLQVGDTRGGRARLIFHCHEWRSRLAAAAAGRRRAKMLARSPVADLIAARSSNSLTRSFDSSGQQSMVIDDCDRAPAFFSRPRARKRVESFSGRLMRTNASKCRRAAALEAANARATRCSTSRRAHKKNVAAARHGHSPSCRPKSRFMYKMRVDDRSNVNKKLVASERARIQAAVRSAFAHTSQLIATQTRRAAKRNDRVEARASVRSPLRRLRARARALACSCSCRDEQKRKYAHFDAHRETRAHARARARVVRSAIDTAAARLRRQCARVQLTATSGRPRGNDKQATRRFISANSSFL